MPRLTREESRTLTREKLMLAAAKVFAREGLGGASIDRIAEEAGYTKGAFYSNFESKEDIFLQLVEVTTKQNIERIETALAGVSEPEEIIDTVCAWANAHTHEPDMRPLVLDLIRHAKQDAALTKRHTELFSKQWTIVGKLLLRAFPKGRAPATALELGALVMELTYGTAVQFHAGPTGGALVKIALNGLMAAAQAPRKTK